MPFSGSKLIEWNHISQTHLHLSSKDLSKVLSCFSSSRPQRPTHQLSHYCLRMPGGIHPPPQVIASWPAPNYENPETRGWSLTITTVVLASIALAVFLLRLWSRLFLTHNAGADDWVLLAAMVRAVQRRSAETLALKRFIGTVHGSGCCVLSG